MKETLKRLYQKYESFILYALYGIPTTVINFGGYAFLMDVCGLDGGILFYRLDCGNAGKL